jgi:hypothetical protein
VRARHCCAATQDALGGRVWGHLNGKMPMTITYDSIDAVVARAEEFMSLGFILMCLLANSPRLVELGLKVKVTK